MHHLRTARKHRIHLCDTKIGKVHHECNQHKRANEVFNPQIRFRVILRPVTSFIIEEVIILPVFITVISSRFHRL